MNDTAGNGLSPLAILLLMPAVGALVTLSLAPFELWPAGTLPTEERVAELLWTSPRTLRRRLAEESTTFRDIAQDLVFARAVQRLQAGRATVREIAEELGYSDAAHFTRFFRRRAGVPPAAYREQVERGRALARGEPSRRSPPVTGAPRDRRDPGTE